MLNILCQLGSGAPIVVTPETCGRALLVNLACRSPKFDRRESFGVSLVRAASLAMINRRVLSLLVTVLAAARSALRTRGALSLENLALRQQLAVLQCRGSRPPLEWIDRLSGSRSRVRGPAGATSSSSSSRLPSCAGTARLSAAAGPGISRRAPVRPPIDRRARPRPTSGAGQPAVGRPAHPWRAAQARHRDLRTRGLAPDPPRAA